MEILAGKIFDLALIIEGKVTEPGSSFSENIYRRSVYTCKLHL
jgi:hypothetical protein